MGSPLTQLNSLKVVPTKLSRSHRQTHFKEGRPGVTVTWNTSKRTNVIAKPTITSVTPNKCASGHRRIRPLARSPVAPQPIRRSVRLLRPLSVYLQLGRSRLLRERSPPSRSSRTSRRCQRGCRRQRDQSVSIDHGPSSSWRGTVVFRGIRLGRARWLVNASGPLTMGAASQPRRPGPRNVRVPGGTTSVPSAGGWRRSSGRTGGPLSWADPSGRRGGS